MNRVNAWKDFFSSKSINSTLEAIMSNYLNLCKEPGSVNPLAAVIRQYSAVPRNHWRKNIVATLTTWVARSSQRRRLAALPQHMLNDIGITLEQQIQESSKPFWVE
jgi:uncharacterized protein YjiS (DUF1127 family)